jgi:hypothetical protein
MTESTEAILTYPEHHVAWLEAMGVTRWQANKPFMKTAALETPIASSTMHNRTVELVTEQPIPQSSLTPQIEMASYWVIGAQPLIPAEAYLLAGMMQAIDAKAVVFSHPADELAQSVMQTGLASWTRLIVQALPLTGLFVVPETVKVLFLGDALFEHAAKSWCLPTLNELLSEPMRKRDAWEILKKAKIA